MSWSYSISLNIWVYISVQIVAKHKQDPNPTISYGDPCTNTQYYVFAQGYTKQVL